ncbi:UvrD-helicase domain-containing protein [Limnohabitans sp. Jir72]|uniref:UvrD-helicase domain-containing protein n=1 Tax=Limnohabitans sp. Jir72 TaxID=1977909 RepID=UPI000D3586C3|nr:UvrD-helicase domain-containing protein [Limnohabitans sp. Jir72]PUE27970.1 hypothetical protein B9Z52_14960 [Limnohabitans sp. Jir72]
MEHEDTNEKIAPINFPLGILWGSQSSRRIYGPPGTGKTTELVNIAIMAISQGVPPENIGYFAFTNVAADEARDKISEKLDIPKSRFINFSTLHSLTTRMGGTEGKQLCQKEHLQKFDLNIGAREEWLRAGDPTSVVVRPIHPVLSEYSIMLNKKKDAPEFSGKSHDDARMLLGNYYKIQIPFGRVEEYAERYFRDYEFFKEQNNLADFNDVIFSVAKESFPEDKIPTFELLIIDEAQDLSALQWDVVHKLASKAKETIIAGDDDQAIMESFGAAPQLFTEFPTSLPDKVLNISWRLPKNIKSYVDKSVNLDSYKYRKDKAWTENPDHIHAGKVSTSILIQEGDSRINIPPKFRPLKLKDLFQIIQIKKSEEWLIMAPTRATCDKISRGLKAMNIPHFLHRQDILSNDSKIHVQTIHTSKGMGVANVALVSVSRGDEWLLNSDSRLKYVALTRAKENLFIINIE